MSGKKRAESSSTEIQTALRERILGDLQTEEFQIKKREVHVMTRLTAEIVEIIDTLVDLEVFRSRSEAVSAYVEKAILSQMDLYEDVQEIAKKLAEAKEAARRMLEGK